MYGRLGRGLARFGNRSRCVGGEDGVDFQRVFAGREAVGKLAEIEEPSGTLAGRPRRPGVRRRDLGIGMIRNQLAIDQHLEVEAVFVALAEEADKRAGEVDLERLRGRLVLRVAAGHVAHPAAGKAVKPH
jgi:hypothetical protein